MNKLVFKLMTDQPDRLVKIFLPKAEKPPEGTKCFKCGSLNMKVIRGMFTHWASGRLVCKDCGFEDSVTNHIMRNLVTATPIEGNGEDEIQTMG